MVSPLWPQCRPFRLLDIYICLIGSVEGKRRMLVCSKIRWEKIKKTSLILNTELFARCFFPPIWYDYSLFDGPHTHGRKAQISLRCKSYLPSSSTTATTALAGSEPVLHQPSSCRRAELSAAHRGDCQMQPKASVGADQGRKIVSPEAAT